MHFKTTFTYMIVAIGLAQAVIPRSYFEERELIERRDTPAMLETRTTCSIYVTSAAANQVRATGMAGEYLRISIQSVGCSGFRYQISVDDTVDHGENTCNSNGVDIVVDSFSMPYLQGATIDYINNSDGNGFTIDNPHCTEF